MGTKLGNIHVNTSDVNEVLAALRSYNEESSKAKPNLKFFFGENYNPEFEGFMNDVDESKSIFFIGEFREGWLSVLNDWFGWGEVESTGKKLSKFIDKNILTIAYYDDDLFELNIFRNGQLLTGHIWCNDSVAEDYQLEINKGNTDYLINFFGNENQENVLTLLRTTDCGKAIEEIETLMNIPLWIKSDWLDDMKINEVASKYIKYNLNL
ncbi:MAG: hypothetical protein J7639_10410 [Paenibacillaceae bacterium]|nr:hypothetical protein [Paenibacillaceae bacterium]